MDDPRDESGFSRPKRVLRELPSVLEVRHPWADVNEIDGPIAEEWIGDVEPSAVLA